MTNPYHNDLQGVIADFVDESVSALADTILFLP